MFLDKIEGIEKIKSKIPYELQYFHKFGNILKLNYEQILDENSYEYINCIEVFLTDDLNRYTIKIFLYNVRGDLSFNIANGFYSGLQIEDLSERGFEKTNKFCISSFEQDNNCLLYCEYIKIELI